MSKHTPGASAAAMRAAMAIADAYIAALADDKSFSDMADELTSIIDAEYCELVEACKVYDDSLAMDPYSFKEKYGTKFQADERSQVALASRMIRSALANVMG